jgi:thiol-disulfide isomerase/thioredoxin
MTVSTRRVSAGVSFVASLGLSVAATVVGGGVLVGALGGCDSVGGRGGGGGGGSASAPPVFDQRPYAEAKAAAAAEGKWFIVKATAVWCGPCKQMDKTTWRDEKVVAWCEANAIVVAVDVDQEPSLAKELAVEGMPTMIAFREGQTEAARVLGFRPAGDFLAWLENL